MAAELRLVEHAPLPYLVSAPDEHSGRPLLCFLHGLDEGAPAAIRQALTRHGPLAASASPLATAEFVVVAAQLPTRGDVWAAHAGPLAEVVRWVQRQYATDPGRAYLTGFSYGGNGVFDLALAQPGAWAALWPVDPTRVPPADPGLPVWLSSGEVSRYHEVAYVRRLRLESPGPNPGDRVYLDEGEDHVGCARRAYADDRIYRWLLSRAAAAGA